MDPPSPVYYKCGVGKDAFIVFNEQIFFRGYFEKTGYFGKLLNKVFNEQLILKPNTHDTRTLLRYSDMRLCCEDCPLLMSSVMHSKDDSNWPVQSSMLSFHDLCGLPLRRLPSTVHCCMIFDSVLCLQRWPNHDNLHCLMVDSWRPARTFYTVITGTHY